MTHALQTDAGARPRPGSRVIRLVRTTPPLNGAGWIAVLLRSVERQGWQFDLETCDIMDIPDLNTDQLVVNIVGLDPAAGLLNVYQFLQEQQSEAAVSFVSGARLPAEVAGFVQECGAVTVVDSIQSAQLSARVIERFFRSRPLSTLGSNLRQLPWTDFSTKN